MCLEKLTIYLRLRGFDIELSWFLIIVINTRCSWSCNYVIDTTLYKIGGQLEIFYYVYYVFKGINAFAFEAAYSV